MSESSEASYLRTQGPKPKKTKYGRYVQDISKEEIESVFCHPAEEACVKLGICLTILKRLCRKFGIPRWPYRRLKGTIKPKQESEKPAQPQVQQKQQQQQPLPQEQHALPSSPEEVTQNLTTSSHHDDLQQQQQRRYDRPQRQAALGVQDAVGRAKADINDNEVATVVVAPRIGKNGIPTTSVPQSTLGDANPIAPAVPEPQNEELAYQSMSAEESQALSVLLGGMGRHRATTTAGVADLVQKNLEAKEGAPPSNVPVLAPSHQQQPVASLAHGIINNNNFMFDPNMLKSMELAMQMHFVAEQQRQQQQQQAAAAAMAAAGFLQNTQNAQIFAAIMQTMSQMNPQDPAAAMLARSMVDTFSTASGLAQLLPPSAWNPPQ